MVSARLTSCSRCDFAIYPDNIYKTVAIPKAPQHIGLVYLCPQCGHKSKLVAEHEEWDDKQRLAREDEANRKRNIRAEQIELDAVESVDDLIALWRSLKNPPILEDRIGVCTCPGCKEKFYGKR